MSARVFFVVLLALTSLSACRAGEDVEELKSRAHALTAADEGAPRTRAEPCHWDCQPCPEDAPCTQECVEQGSCGSVCGVYLQCDAGYDWDEIRCACVHADAAAAGSPG